MINFVLNFFLSFSFYTGMSTQSSCCFVIPPGGQWRGGGAGGRGQEDWRAGGRGQERPCHKDTQGEAGRHNKNSTVNTMYS